MRPRANEVEIFRSLDHIETEMVAGALAEAGISYTVRDETAGALRLAGIDSHWAPGQWRVLCVPGVAVEDAEDVVASIRGGPPVLHVVDSEPPAGFYARRKRTIGALVLVPFVVAFTFAVLSLFHELTR